LAFDSVAFLVPLDLFLHNKTVEFRFIA